MFTDIHSGYDALRRLMSGPTSFLTWIILILMIVGYWKMFSKAGYPGWLSLIPFVNAWILFKMAMGSGFFLLLMLIPIVNIIVLIMAFVNLAHKFGYSGLFALGLIFFNPIFVMMIGFSEAQWQD